MWYKREERHYRISLFFSAASLAGAFGGVLAWVSDNLEESYSEANSWLQGIAHMRGVGGLNGWRWIFILEGILTVLVSLTAYSFIANYPSTANFLTDKERACLHARLASNNDATRNEAFTWQNVRLALSDPKVWLYGLGFHTMSLPLYTLSLFLLAIIRGLGYTAAQAQLLTVPPYAVAFLFTLAVAVASEKLSIRAPFIMGSASFAVIGYIILLSCKKPGVAYIGTIFAAAGIYPATAIVLSWPANNISGQTKRATANAMQISIGNLGAVLGTQLYRSRDAPRFFVGHGFAMGYLCINVVVVGSLWAILRAENARRDKGERNNRLVGVATDEWLGDDDPRWTFQT
jgi:Major Facilitator Superfamily